MNTNAAAEKAPRCEMSGRTQSVDREAWINDTPSPCLGCGNVVKIRVRATDLSPWAKVQPHRVDGTPSR